MIKPKKYPSKRIIQIFIGILWLIDGTLQLQHQMFTSNFASQVIAPAALGQPRFVSGLMHLGIHIFLLHPVIFNAFFAIIQLCLGILILNKRTVKVGLISSAVWGLIVWSIGEGYGGLFSLHTTLLMGAPGAAILYVLLSLAVLPSTDRPDESDQDQNPAYWLAIVWFILWLGGAIYQLLPGQDSISSLSSMIAGNATTAPGWLATIDKHTVNIINSFAAPAPSAQAMHMTTMQMSQMTNHNSSGYLFIFLFAVMQACIGFGVLRPGIVRKLAISTGIIVMILFWFIGQSLGGYCTGLATDPNSAPLFILIGAAILSCSNIDLKLFSLWSRIESMLVGKPSAKN